MNEVHGAQDGLYMSTQILVFNHNLHVVKLRIFFPLLYVSILYSYILHIHTVCSHIEKYIYEVLCVDIQVL